MSFHYSPKIVTDGLVFCIDAANPKSFVNGNTTWNDLSRSGNDGTLINGPTFDSTNGGSIVFDGVNDYVNVGNIGDYSTLSYTLESFVYPEFDSSTFGRNFLSKSTSCNSTEFTFEYGRQTNKFTFVSRNDITLVSNSTYPKNNWYHAVLSRTNNNNGTYTNRLYINGVLDNTTTVNYSPNGGNGIIGIGLSINCTNVGYWLGEIAMSRIYNKALTSSEILQNYNALKTRFGL
jgi:hypothetical protein